MYQVSEITSKFPDVDISIKLTAWYNWLYSQLEEYESYEVCPLEDVEIETEAELLSILVKLAYGDFAGAISEYLFLELAKFGATEGRRLMRDLSREVQRRLVREA